MIKCFFRNHKDKYNYDRLMAHAQTHTNSKEKKV